MSYSGRVVEIAGNPYVVALDAGGRLMFASGTRALEGRTTNDDRIVWREFGEMGRGFLATDRNLTTVPGKLLPNPKRSTLSAVTISAVNSRTTPRYFFETQDANDDWWLFAIAPQVIYKIDIESDPPVVVRWNHDDDAYGVFNDGDRYGQPAQSANGWIVPTNDAGGERFYTLTAASDEASQAFDPVVTLDGAIDDSTTIVVYTSTGDPIAQGDVIIIDSERMRVKTVVTATNTLSVERGFAGTTAASHTDTTAITQATPDTWTKTTGITGGAGQFVSMPDGKIWRSLVFSSGAYISSLQPGADPDTDGNWGGDIAAGIPDGAYILALQNYEDLLLVGRQNAWLAYQENADGTLQGRNLLPDSSFYDRGDETGGDALSEPHLRPGGTWHARAILITPNNLWATAPGVSALPIGPDALQALTASEAAANAETTRGGFVSAVQGGTGAWMYALYDRGSASGGTGKVKLLACREGGNDPGVPVQWENVCPASGYTSGRGLHLQKNGTGAGTRLWFTSNAVEVSGVATQYFDYIEIAPDGDPYAPDGDFGQDGGGTDRHYLLPVLFPCRVQGREWRFLIENGDAECTFGIEIAKDGANPAASSGFTGSVDGVSDGRQSVVQASPGSNDKWSRVMPVIVRTRSGDFEASSTPPIVLELVLEFTYLPDAGDALAFTVDLEATARMRNVEEETLLTELKALREAGASAWRDFYESTGYVLVRAVDVTRAPKPVGPGPPTGAYAFVQATIEEYS